jgi:hypothetical protein
MDRIYVGNAEMIQEMNNGRSTRKISKLLRLHLKKQNKDLVEFQKEIAVLICDEIMERVKHQIHDVERESKNMEGDILNFYRLSVMNQIRFILEVSDEIEAEFRQQIKQVESLK